MDIIITNGGGGSVLHQVTSHYSAIQESLGSGLRPLLGCNGGSLLWSEGPGEAMCVHTCMHTQTGSLLPAVPQL